ncbi:hypothetical protein SA2424_SA2424_02662 [Staphylococcus aureus]|nr:hypothetical protein SA2424_SA2424_02662 [Staphylococcus aureus]
MVTSEPKLAIAVPNSDPLYPPPTAQKPIVKDGEIVAAPVLALSLSFDHRQIDGATG